jgi:hypothetical protein
MMVACRKRHTVTIPSFPEQREKQPEQARKVLLDAGGDDVAQARARLDVLHLPVKPRQRHDRFNAVLAKRLLELTFGVGRVQRRDDGRALPGPQLGDQELRAVGEEKGDPIASTDAERPERSRACVAQPLELAVGKRRTLEEHRGRVRLLARRPGETVEERGVRIRRERGRDVLVVVGEPRGTGHRPRPCYRRVWGASSISSSAF